MTQLDNCLLTCLTQAICDRLEMVQDENVDAWLHLGEVSIVPETSQISQQDAQSCRVHM